MAQPNTWPSGQFKKRNLAFEHSIFSCPKYLHVIQVICSLKQTSVSYSSAYSYWKITRNCLYSGSNTRSNIGHQLWSSNIGVARSIISFYNSCFVFTQFMYELACISFNMLHNDSLSYRASTQLRYQNSENCLEDEPRAWTPIRQSLLSWNNKA